MKGCEDGVMAKDGMLYCCPETYCCSSAACPNGKLCERSGYMNLRTCQPRTEYECVSCQSGWYIAWDGGKGGHSMCVPNGGEVGKAAETLVKIGALLSG
jgi:hypothetical protein